MFVDIHTHIIPGIDDGAEDSGIAAGMLDIAVSNGTRHIVATPHFIPGTLQNNCDEVDNKCLELRQMAADEGLDIEIYPGNEVFISPDVPELFEKGAICTLNKSSYMLIELPMLGIPIYTDAVLYELQIRGVVPIIAHPERIRSISANLDILSDYVRRGMFAQVNSGSITGIYGKTVQSVAMNIIKADMAHFVASDAHTCGGRSPNLDRAASIIAYEYGLESVERLFYTNGMAVIEGVSVL